MDYNTDILSDGQLYIRFLKTKDEEAFRTIYEKYRDGLVLFLRGYVSNLDDAEELMMDTFAVLVSGVARYREQAGSSFKTWLYAVAKNQAKMYLRKHKDDFFVRTTETDTAPDLSGSVDPEQDLLSREQSTALYAALDKLPSDYRQILYLMYFEDMKPAEISGRR